MEINKTNTYTLVTSSDSSFHNFLKCFNSNYNSFDNQNIIVNILSIFNVSEKDILLLLPNAKEQQEKGFSFVVIANNIDIDNLPDEFNVVPTLQEAEDVIEMENIQRDLGI